MPVLCTRQEMNGPSRDRSSQLFCVKEYNNGKGCYTLLGKRKPPTRSTRMRVSVLVTSRALSGLGPDDTRMQDRSGRPAFICGNSSYHIIRRLSSTKSAMTSSLRDRCCAAFSYWPSPSHRAASSSNWYTRVTISRWRAATAISDVFSFR